jgi:hypothetical protein
MHQGTATLEPTDQPPNTEPTTRTHSWLRLHTTTGPLAGRGIVNERCGNCEVRLTPPAMLTTCPPAWEDEGQI